VSAELPPLDPRPRSEGLPPLGPAEPGAADPGGLPPIPPRPTAGLPPIDDRGRDEPAAAVPPSRPGRPRREMPRGARTAALVAAAVVAAGVVGGVSGRVFRDDPAPAPAAEAPAVTTTPASATVTKPDLTDAVARVSPTVVEVQTDAGSQGSGVILSPSGLVVTNHHVIAGATNVTLVTAGGLRVPATIVNDDQRQDLAILKPQGEVGRGAELANNPDAGLRQGDQVFAIGSPFGLQNTVTAGIVSAVGRTNDEGVPMIQIDAPINPGNSGGGLFDLDGRLVGIPTSIFGPISGNVGIGFAVPASRVRAMVESAP
jgi:putative serine protease PepD